MPCYSFEGLIPVIHPSAYVHPTAVLIGDVVVGPGVYIAPLASLRGDFGRIVLEEGSNLQDHCMMHGAPNQETIIRVNAHIGHGAILHGCTVGEDSLVGMDAVVMDRAEIGPESIVGAMSFVKKGFQGKRRQLLLGIPARVVRTLSDEDIRRKRKGTAEYQALARRSASTLHEVQPLTEPEAGRPTLRGFVTG
ncbi:Phenylacetic acid degradation protein OS=Castellaniella defragrans OX=75697 GN=HNR28_001264 PE=4 SV=1 [Castellaniella defragrans]